MGIKYRDSVCLVCGNVQPLLTNHIRTCFAYCHSCSWKCFGFDPGNNSAMFGNHAYRRFQVTDKETYTEEKNGKSSNDSV